MQDKVVEIELSEILEENIGKIFGPRTFKRHIPYFKDGLLPVIRRIIMVFHNNNMTHNSSFIKSASIVGDTMKSYHPHGDASIYTSIVKHTAKYRINHPYFFGKGNWGNSNGDPEASMRYTECKPSEFLYDVILCDLSKECVDWQESEFGQGYPDDPVYLPTRIPLMLINGTEGIAEAFTTGIPPHNLSEIADRCIKYIQNKNITLEEIIKGLAPDYPTYGTIINGSELFETYKSGDGKIVLRANIIIDNNNNQLILKELPYGVTYDVIKNQILTARNEKNNLILSKIIRDSEEKDENKNLYWKLICNKDANLLEILNELYKVTSLKKTYPFKMRINYGDKTRITNVLEIIKHWYNTRVGSVTRNLVYQKNKLEVRIHILEGLVKFLNQKDEIINFIKSAESKQYVIENLPKNFDLTQVQSKEIAETALHILTKLSTEDLLSRIENLRKQLDEVEYKLNHIDDIIVEQLQSLKKKHGRERRTQILMSEQIESTSKSIQKGSLLVAYNSIAIMDDNALFNTKNVLNGLKNMKIDNVYYKNIIKVDSFNNDNDLEGIIVFYKDNTVRKIPLKDIPTFNTWINITNDIPLIDAVPYSNENDCLLVISEDMKIKFVRVSTISNRKANCSPINCVKNITGSEDVLIINNRGEYWRMDLHIWDGVIPELNMNAVGIKCPFEENYGKMVIEVKKSYYDSDKFLIQYVVDDVGWIIAIESKEFEIVNSRSNKPKKILEFYKSETKIEINGLSGIKEFDGKKRINSTILMIGKNNINKLDIKHFRGNRIVKKVLLHSLSSIQIIKE